MADIESVGVGEIEAVNSDDRRNLLAEQLDALEPAKADVIETPEKTAERARAADGKFAAKTEVPEKIEAIAEPTWKKPPQSWKKELHEPWQTLDPRYQEYIHTREADMQKGLGSAKERAVKYDQIENVMKPYMATIQGMGIDAPRAIKGLMEADNILRTAPHDQKRDYIMRLAQSYGINLGDVSNAPAVNPEIFEVRNQLNQLQGKIAKDQQDKEAAEQQSLLNDIQKFAKDKEYFEEAKPTMIQLLQSGVAIDLDDAYKKAVKLNDDLFERDQAAQQAKAGQEKIRSKDQAAKAARSAAVGVKSSTPGVITATKAQDRRSKLAEQFAELDERL